MSTLEPLMEQNFLEYASYVIVERAIPDIRDGCKPVQRRILHTLFGADDGKYHKVANIVGETMKLHPHGDASIYDALVTLANKEYFIEKQGNYGSVITGHSAAAARYIECRLTDLARETLFNKNLTQWTPSYDGRKEEPTFLPTKLPVILMLGIDGIAVGMSTKILSHNFPELLQAQIDILRDKPIACYPDFLHGGQMDVTDYADGKGKVKLRAKMEAKGEKQIVIKEIPFGTTTESLIASIENAAQKGKVKIAGISDFTTEAVEIEITLPRGIYADEVMPQLFAYTDCEVSVSSNMVVIRDKTPVELTVSEMLLDCTVQLKNTLKAELEWELSRLEDKHHWLTLEQIFIENRVYKRIEEQETAEGVVNAVYTGMNKFKKLFVRDLVDGDIDRLLEIRIRRISRYDIDKNRKDIDDVVKAIKSIQSKLRRMTQTTIKYLEGLIKKYGDRYPRRTEITTFTEVDVRSVARANLKVSYDKDSGFWGTSIKNGDYAMTLSEYDRVLVVLDSGEYRILAPQDKVLLEGKIIYLEQFNEETGVPFTVVYKDAKRIAYVKQVEIKKYVTNREYSLVKDPGGKIALLMNGHPQGTLHCTFSKTARQRVTECTFDLSTLSPTSPTAKGNRIAAKAITKIKYQK